MIFAHNKRNKSEKTRAFGAGNIFHYARLYFSVTNIELLIIKKYRIWFSVSDNFLPLLQRLFGEGRGSNASCNASVNDISTRSTKRNDRSSIAIPRSRAHATLIEDIPPVEFSTKGGTEGREGEEISSSTAW